MSACQGLLALDGHLLTLRTLLFLMRFEVCGWRLTQGSGALRRQLRSCQSPQSSPQRHPKHPLKVQRAIMKLVQN